MVSVCVPSDVLLQCLLSYLGFSYLGVWYLFRSTPSKHSRCSLPWTRGISLLLQFLSMWDSSSRPSCSCSARAPRVAPPGRGPWPRARGGSSRSPLLASGARWLLLAAPDLGRGVSPPGHHWPRTRGSSSRPPPRPRTRGVSSRPPLTSDAGCLLPAAATDLGLRVAPLGCSCAVAAWLSRPLPLTSDVG